MKNTVGNSIKDGADNDESNKWEILTEENRTHSINELIDKRPPVHQIGEKITARQLEYDAVDEAINIFEAIEDSDFELAGMEARDGFLDIYAKSNYDEKQKMKISLDLARAKTTFGFSREFHNSIMPGYIAYKFAGYGIDVYDDDNNTEDTIQNSATDREPNFDLTEEIVSNLHEKIEQTSGNLLDSGYTDDKSYYTMMYACDGSHGKYEASVVVDTKNPDNITVFFQNTNRVGEEAKDWKSIYGLSKFKRKDVFSDKKITYDKMSETLPPLDDDLKVEYYPLAKPNKVSPKKNEGIDDYSDNGPNPPVGAGVMTLGGVEPDNPPAHSEARYKI